jgi:hypothetical protein
MELSDRKRDPNGSLALTQAPTTLRALWRVFFLLRSFGHSHQNAAGSAAVPIRLDWRIVWRSKKCLALKKKPLGVPSGPKFQSVSVLGRNAMERFGLVDPSQVLVCRARRSNSRDRDDDVVACMAALLGCVCRRLDGALGGPTSPRTG